MKGDNIFLVYLAIFVSLVVVLIVTNIIRHSNYVEKFEIKCNERGGMMFTPKVSKGRAYPECRNPNSMINME